MSPPGRARAQAGTIPSPMEDPMSERKDAVSPESPPEEVRGASRRQFLGSAAVAAVAVSGASTLLAACGESTPAPAAASGAAPNGRRGYLGGGRDPGVTLHSMMVATMG